MSVAGSVTVGADRRDTERGVQLVDLGAKAGPASGRSWMMIGHSTLRALVPVALLAVWQTASTLGAVEPTVLPSPLTVVEAFGELIGTGELQSAIPA